jgi:hypothetical protein
MQSIVRESADFGENYAVDPFNARCDRAGPINGHWLASIQSSSLEETLR